MGSDEKDLSIQELYAEITDNDFRNQQIVEDVLKNYSQGRNCIVLSLRTAHVELLAKKLKAEVPDVITLMGGMGKKLMKQALIRCFWPCRYHGKARYSNMPGDFTGCSKRKKRCGFMIMWISR